MSLKLKSIKKNRNKSQKKNIASDSNDGDQDMAEVSKNSENSNENEGVASGLEFEGSLRNDDEMSLKPKSIKKNRNKSQKKNIPSGANDVDQDVAEVSNNSEKSNENEGVTPGLEFEGSVRNDDEMDLGSLRKSSLENSKRKRKKGIIYISNIPKHMNVTRIREILGEIGKIGRVYLQPEKLPVGTDKSKKKRKPFARHFTEGWVEFESKRIAKQIVPILNNKQISTRKKSQFYDHIWSMKYLPRFKWCHLTERMNYEQAVHKQRLMTEVSQARKETTFFQNNLDKSEFIKKKEKIRQKMEAKKLKKQEGVV